MGREQNRSPAQPRFGVHNQVANGPIYVVEIEVPDVPDGAVRSGDDVALELLDSLCHKLAYRAAGEIRESGLCFNRHPWAMECYPTEGRAVRDFSIASSVPGSIKANHGKFKIVPLQPSAKAPGKSLEADSS
jgi:hypothetical protein